MRIFLSFEATNTTFLNDVYPALLNIDIAPITLNLKQLFAGGLDKQAEFIATSCDFVIIVLSSSYVKSQWMKHELDFLLKWESDRKGSNWLLPIIVEDCKIPGCLEDRSCADFRRGFHEGFKQLTELIAQRRKAFVVMKFDDEILDSTYEGVIKPIFEEFRYFPSRIDEEPDSGPINQQILERIKSSEIVFADLTGKSPNCYFEVGYALALSKSIILTIRKGEFPIPFDLSTNRFIVWSTENDLRNKLRKRLKAIQNSTKSDI